MVTIFDAKKKMIEVENKKFSLDDGDSITVGDLEYEEDDGSVFITSKETGEEINFKDSKDYSIVGSYFLLKNGALEWLKKMYLAEDAATWYSQPIKCLYKNNKELIRAILAGETKYTAYQWFEGADITDEDETLTDEEYIEKLSNTADMLVTLLIDYTTAIKLIQTMYGNNKFETDNDMDYFYIGDESTEGLIATNYETEEDIEKDLDGWAVQVLKDIQEFCDNI